MLVMERLKQTENETIELTDYEEIQNQPHHVSEMEPVKQFSFLTCILWFFMLLIVLNLIFSQPNQSVMPQNLEGMVNGTTAFAMTCAVGESSALGGGVWKPHNQIDGAEFVLSQLNTFNRKSINFVFGIFEGDNAEREICNGWVRKFSNVNVVCFEMDLPLPQGYGMPKIYFIAKVPAQRVVWMDCDSFLVADYEQLLQSFKKEKTSAYFWADIEGFHYKPQPNVFTTYGVEFDRKNYKHVTGFDSGFMIIDKFASEKALKFLLEEICGNIASWERFSSGDKDLWHLAWDLTETSYRYIHWVGGLASRATANKFKWKMVGQIKFDESGNPVVMHQIWRDIHGRKEDVIRMPDFLIKRDITKGKALKEGTTYISKNYESQPASEDIRDTVVQAAKAWKHEGWEKFESKVNTNSVRKDG